MNLYTHLNFGGNCKEAFEFYEKNLGGKITMMMSRGDAPMPDPGAAGSGDKAAIIHARLQLAGTELIGNDVPPDQFQPIRSSYLYLALDSAAEAERVYAVLSQGGQVFMPLQEAFFAERFAMLRDRFGVGWPLIRERPRS